MIKNRIFRESKKAIPNTCRGFFCDYRHLENHFKFLTSTNGLTDVVERNFKQQMGEKNDLFIRGLGCFTPATYRSFKLLKYLQNLPLKATRLVFHLPSSVGNQQICNALSLL